MVGAEHQIYGLSQAFRGASSSVKADLTDLAHSGQYHLTPQMKRELYHINNGINHVKFDNQLLNSSPGWANNFNSASLAVEKQGEKNGVLLIFLLVCLFTGTNICGDR